jgi:DNA-binding MarR family transcriptional regulator
MDILSGIHRAEQAAALLFSENVAAKMTVRQAVVLKAVLDTPGCSQTDLVNATGVDRSTLADIVRRLQRRGWLQRRRTKEDARAYAVQLTPEGHKALQSARHAATKTEKQLADKFPGLKAMTANGH